MFFRHKTENKSPARATHTKQVLPTAVKTPGLFQWSAENKPVAAYFRGGKTTSFSAE